LHSEGFKYAEYWKEEKGENTEVRGQEEQKLRRLEGRKKSRKEEIEMSPG